jgi:hypothetical protein
MRYTFVLLLLAFSALAACDSPEDTRSRGGGPGADVGNRGKVVDMHEGSQPFWKTPQLIASKHPPLESARQADQLSRQ